MNNEQMAARLYSNISGIEMNKFRDLELEKDDWYHMGETKHQIAGFDAIWNYGASSLDKLTELIEEHDPDVVFVDCIQLKTVNNFKSSRQEEVAKISRTLKQQSLTNGSSRLIIAASQVNREGIKGKDYNNANIFRDSGALEQDADVALVLAPVLDPAGGEDETKRKVHIVASRWSARTSFLVEFSGARSRVAGTTQAETDFSEIVQNCFNGHPDHEDGNNGSNSRGKPW